MPRADSSPVLYRSDGRVRVVNLFTVVVSRDPELPGWVVVCPAMPGAVTQGASREAALDAMSEVMAAWIELALEQGFQPFPETPELVAEKVASVLEDRDAAGWDRTIETAMLRPAAVAAA